MQPTIASYFQKSSASTNGSSGHKSKETKHEPKKRKARVISSDEDDDLPKSPKVSKSRDKKKSKVENTATSSPTNNKKTNLNKVKSPKKVSIKPVDPMFLFGGETKRVEAKKPTKPKEKAMLEFEDNEIDQSLMEIDLEESVLENQKQEQSAKKKSKKSNENHSQDHKKSSEGEMDSSPSPKKEEKKESSSSSKKEEKMESSSSSKKEEKKESSSSSKNEERKESSLASKIEEKNESSSKKEEKTTPKENKKLEKHKKSSPKDDDEEEKHKPKNKKSREKHQDLESSVLSDEERHDRKRMTAILYQKYKNRSAVLNPGSKEVPKGKPNCLAGLTFLVTGVLESLERDEAGSIIKEYGGKTMTVVGKRLNYLIVGEESGPKKLAQAEEFGVKIISEDGFFNLIREKSGLKKEQAHDSSIRDDGEKPTTSPKSKKGDSKENKEQKEKVEIKKEKLESPTKRKTKLEELNNNLGSHKIKKETADPKPEVNQIKKQVEVKQEFPRPPPVTEDMMTWVDKYKPATVKDIIGQQGAASNVFKLTNWLSKWYINHDGKKKLQKPNPWAKNDDGSYYKAALLSGPPGIGKTTTATLVCKELGFDAVEFNASDTRSKRLLKEEVSELLSNKSLYGYFHGNDQAVTKKHVLIMDEVDGMAGNEDRGGIQELIGLIKESSVPIICMCNDRNHQKMRSLVNYCYDLRFNRPQLKQIKGRIMSICAKENIKLDSGKIDEIIAATNNDIRQSINHISLLSAGKDLNLASDKESTKYGEKTAEKDLKMGPWEVVRKVFSADEHKSMTFNDKCDLFFHDYSLAPLFVQQNYLIVSPSGPKSEVLQKVALTANALSLGDLVDKKIRSSSAWALLPTQAIFSSVMPGEYMSGHITGQINFPGWLGKNSRSTKRCRLAQEIHDHTRLRTSGSRLSVRLDYSPFLLNKIVKPLVDKGLDGIEESLATLKEYHLLREDIDSLIELTTWPGKKGPMDKVDGRVKAALTRAYNKEVLAYTYSATAGVKKKRAEAADDMDQLGMQEGEEGTANVESEDEKDDDLENDALIKAKKKTSSSTTKASTSKAATGKKAKAPAKPKK